MVFRTLVLLSFYDFQPPFYSQIWTNFDNFRSMCTKLQPSRNTGRSDQIKDRPLRNQIKIQKIWSKLVPSKSMTWKNTENVKIDPIWTSKVINFGGQVRSGQVIKKNIKKRSKKGRCLPSGPGVRGRNPSYKEKSSPWGRLKMLLVCQSG